MITPHTFCICLGLRGFSTATAKHLAPTASDYFMGFSRWVWDKSVIFRLLRCMEVPSEDILCLFIYRNYWRSERKDQSSMYAKPMMLQALRTHLQSWLDAVSSPDKNITHETYFVSYIFLVVHKSAPGNDLRAEWHSMLGDFAKMLCRWLWVRTFRLWHQKIEA